MARQDASRGGKRARQFAKQPTNTFPSDTIPNPREECKAIQLRNGKSVENDKGAKKKQAEEDKNDQASSKKEEESQALKKGKQVMEEQPQEKKKGEVKPYAPKLPYPQRLHKEMRDQQFPKFLEIFRKLKINILLVEALEKMPLYAKFLKELITKKRSWNEKEKVVLTQECSAIIQKGLPPKLKDPGSFFILCTIRNMAIDKALCDLGASINLMHLAMMKKLMIEEVKPTRMSLQLADKSLKIPNGVVENLLVKVGKFIFPADFVILDMDEEGNNLIILGRPFLATTRAIIDVEKGEMVLRVHEEQMVINVFKAIQYPTEKEKFMRINIVDDLVEEAIEADQCEDHVGEAQDIQEKDSQEEQALESSSEVKEEGAPKQELKPLPPYLKYAFLDGEDNHPVIINSSLSKQDEAKLIGVLKTHKTTIGWTIDDIKGISPALCMHNILLEEDSRPVVQPQRRLNPTMKEVVQKEDAKPRLIKWVLLLQEFDIEVKDRKGIENQVADHLSRLLQGTNQESPQPMNEKFPDENLLQIQQAPWFADTANYKAGRNIPQYFIRQQVKKLLTEAKLFLWDELFLFKRCPDKMIQRCVLEDEMRDVLLYCHNSSYGGHFGAERIAVKILQSGFYWPSIFKDAREFVSQCNECQRTGGLTRKNEMPQKYILEVELFDIWEIDFMGPFPPSYSFKYILVAVEYVSKWVEAIETTTCDASVVLQFLRRNTFTKCGVPKGLISDGGSHFYNKHLNTLLHSYGVTHKVATPYHP
ncbi:uncharacterized protein [Arachis hypogaea]|uniref:uncharacterized protein n=1 Tax=Arachis hypogaea TaxID=3818 RepID=UPI003B21411D